MRHLTVSRLASAGLLTAVAVVGSLFSFPAFGSNCAPVQHMVNIICAVLLWPWYGVGVAFSASLLRNLLGLGTLMAFPGSMFGALLCGLAYALCRKVSAACLAEVFGTAVLGGLAAYPVAILLIGAGCGRGGLLRLHHPLPDLHSGGSYPVRDSYLWLGENGRFVPIPEYAQQTDCIRRKNCAAGNA